MKKTLIILTIIMMVMSVFIIVYAQTGTFSPHNLFYKPDYGASGVLEWETYNTYIDKADNQIWDNKTGIAAIDLSLYYLKTDINTQAKMETIWGVSLCTDSELTTALANYYLKTAIDTQAKMETIWGVTLATDAELAALKFTDLPDTPANYTGSANKFLQVNATPDAIIFDTIKEADISDLGTTTAMVADNLSVFAPTTSAELAGVISDETGTGKLMFADNIIMCSSYDHPDDAITAIGADNKTLLVTETETCDVNFTVPANVTVKFERGGKWTINNGITITFNGQIDAGGWQIFNCVGTGKITFGNSPSVIVHPDWWYSDNWSTAINMAIQSKNANYYTYENPFVVFLPGNIIDFAETIVIDRGYIDFNGRTLNYTGSGTAIQVTVRDAMFTGLNLMTTQNFSNENLIGIEMAAGKDNKYQAYSIMNFTVGLYINGISEGISYNTFDIQEIASCKTAIKIENTYPGWITECVFTHSRLNGPGKTVAGSYGIQIIHNSGTMGALRFMNLTIEGFETAVLDNCSFGEDMYFSPYLEGNGKHFSTGNDCTGIIIYEYWATDPATVLASADIANATTKITQIGRNSWNLDALDSIYLFSNAYKLYSIGSGHLNMGFSVLCRDVNNSSLQINGGNLYNTGASLQLNGSEAPNANHMNFFANAYTLYNRSSQNVAILDINGNLWLNGNLTFEGSSVDAYETTFSITNPTADRTIIVPDSNQTIGTATTLANNATIAGNINMNEHIIIHETKTIADGDTTPDVSSGEIFITSANTAATAITDLDNPTIGQIVTLIGGSDTNSSTITDGSSIGAVTFTGTGLNDMTTGGTFTGTVDTNFKVEIDGTGTPDTFKWSDDGGATWDATLVAITGAAQTLNNGVTITFGATTGHTLADYWTFTTYPDRFKLSAAMTLGLDDSITLFVKEDDYYIELSRSVN